MTRGKCVNRDDREGIKWKQKLKAPNEGMRIAWASVQKFGAPVSSPRDHQFSLAANLTRHPIKTHDSYTCNMSPGVYSYGFIKKNPIFFFIKILNLVIIIF